MVEAIAYIDSQALGSPTQGFAVSSALYCSEECRLLHDSNRVRIEELERMVSDHSQRFDTLQTPLWKRIWFWIDGWPYYDLNGTQRRRPWHRR